jgi:hypothetical protein
MPIYLTMNMPRLTLCPEYNCIENPIICSSNNKIGFRMSGGKEIYENTSGKRIQAYSPAVLAAGSSQA